MQGLLKTMSIVAYPKGKSLEENRKCPHCEGKLHRHGRRRRILVRNGVCEDHSLQRYRCSACKRCLTVLAEDMLPYKHHAASEMEAALEDIPEAEPADYQVESSTFRSWRMEFKGWLAQALGVLQNRFLQEGTHPEGLVLEPLQAFRHLLSLLPKDRHTLFETTLEYVYWISHPLRI